MSCLGQTGYHLDKNLWFKTLSCFVMNIKFIFSNFNFITPTLSPCWCLTHKQLENAGHCILSNVATDALVLQYPQCWLKIHCIVPVSYINNTFIGNIKKQNNIWTKIPQLFKVCAVDRGYTTLDHPGYLPWLCNSRWPHYPRFSVNESITSHNPTIWHSLGQS